MVEIKNLKVYDMEEAILASSYPMLTDYPTEDNYESLAKYLHKPYFIKKFYKWLANEGSFEEELIIAFNHFKRVYKLSQVPSGSGHDNFLKGIRVSFDLKYPNYFSPELQRYNWIDIVSSSSKMHKLTNMDMDLCFNKYVTPYMKDYLKGLLDIYKDEPSYKNFMTLLSNCPLGIELFMRISTNYLQLKTIYHQRKNHKLQEDWGAFIAMIEGLPFANEFIIKKGIIL